VPQAPAHYLPCIVVEIRLGSSILSWILLRMLRILGHRGSGSRSKDPIDSRKYNQNFRSGIAQTECMHLTTSYVTFAIFSRRIMLHATIRLRILLGLREVQHNEITSQPTLRARSTLTDEPKEYKNEFHKEIAPDSPGIAKYIRAIWESRRKFKVAV
jgi:hypothetical protein